MYGAASLAHFFCRYLSSKIKNEFSMMIIAVEMWILFRDEIWKSELSNLMNSRM